MKFLNLHLKAYGPFEDKLLEFDPTVPFQLIYGDNEAGKSTSLRAVEGFLFGIPGQTKDTHRFIGPQLRIGATLQKEGSHSLALVRRKGNKDTLLNTGGTKLDEAVLTAFLGGISLEMFKSQFCFSHDALREGSEELANSNGALGSSLFQAGGNLRSLTELKAAFARDEAILLKGPALRSGKIQDQLNALKPTRQSIKEHSLSPTERVAREKSLAEQQAELKRLRTNKAELVKQLNRLSRVKAALPVVSELRNQRAAIAELGSVVKLPADAALQREKWEQARDSALKSAEKVEANITKTKATVDGIAIPEELRTQGEEVMAFYQQLDSFREAKRKLPDAQAQLKQKEQAAQERLQELKAHGEIGSPDTLRTMLKKLPKLRTQANQKQLLDQQLKGIEAAALKLARKQEEQQGKLRELRAGVDTAPLQRALKKAGQAAAIEDQLARSHSALTLLSTQIKIDVQALSLWQGTLDALVALPLPLESTVKRFEQELRDNATRLAQKKDEQETLEQQAKTFQGEIDQLVSQGRLWTEAELETLRQERDRAWQHIRNLWLGVPGEAADGEGLANDYEALVDQADRAADTLHKEAKRVAELQLLHKQLEGNAKAQQKNSEEKAGIEKQTTTLNESWANEWRLCGIVPLPPGEMLDWLVRQKEICARAREIDKLRLEMQEQQDQIKGWRDELSEAMRSLGQDALPENEKLTDSLARLEEWQAEQDALTAAREKLEEEIARSSEELKDKNRELEELKAQDLKTWQEEWEKLTRELGALGAGEPEEVVRTFEDVDGYVELARECATLAGQAEEYERVVESFTTDVASLVSICAPDLANLPPENAVSEMKTRLNTANLDAERLITARAKLEELEQELPGFTEQTVTANKALIDLMTAAGCIDGESLKAAESQSERLRELEEKVQKNLDTLATHAAGADTGAFVAELEAEDADAVEAQLSNQGEELEAVEKKLEELVRSIGLLEEELGKEAGHDALDSAQQSQDILRQLQDSVERYVRVKLSRLILEQEIERYRQTNQNPVLARTSELFRQLTCDSFQGVDVSEQKEDQYLVGVRADKNELRAEEMSDGTRDQLFLALRMASLENHLQHSTALPLIVDDILVNFDDKRAAAAFEVLGEVSQKTQVLFFTHHSRLADLGREVLGSGMQVNEL